MFPVIFSHPSPQVMEAYKQVQAAASNFGAKVAAYEMSFVHAQNLYYHKHSEIWLISSSMN
jgi:hypothetical protein